jgi:hypothetical protein
LEDELEQATQLSVYCRYVSRSLLFLCRDVDCFLDKYSFNNRIVTSRAR